MAKNREPVDIDVEVVRQGDSAVLVTDGDLEVWIPHSLIDRDSDINADSDALESGTITIPQWKAEELGLI